MKLSEYIEKYGDKQVDVDKLSEFIIEDKVFEPKANEDYFFISVNGVVGKTARNRDSDEDLIRYQQVYRTEAEAEFARDKAIFLEFMRKEFLRNSDVIDWKNGNQIKYDIYYNRTQKLIEIDTAYRHQRKGLFTRDKNWLEAFVYDHYDEIKKYYFEVKED